MEYTIGNCFYYSTLQVFGLDSSSLPEVVKKLRIDVSDYINDNFQTLFTSYKDYCEADTDIEKEQKFRELLSPHRKNFTFCDHIIMNITVDYLNSREDKLHYNVVCLNYNVVDRQLFQQAVGFASNKDDNKEKRTVYIVRFEYSDRTGQHFEGTSLG